ncbi:GTPase Era, mitochondrial [Athalia rosae]|uniref:GTPase Era, mitochondrial n=1 Tax=Athalia rosae TaxID=37344 RepID=UPI00062688DE|nr:GTPase Era, mitochondrial [Athalia rosae]
MFGLRIVPTRILSRTNTNGSLANLARLGSTGLLEKYDIPIAAEHDFPQLRREERKSLRIAILGAPNAGKSTLINQLVEHQVCASSMRKHTTRSACRAIHHFENIELVFVDTPGVVSSRDVVRHSLEKSFRLDPGQALGTADVVGVLHDISQVTTRDQINPEIISLLKTLDSNARSLLLLNKVDKIKSKTRLLQFVDELTGTNGWPHFVDVFMLSALLGDGVQDLRHYLLDSAKPREWDYERDTLTDQKPEEMVLRIVRAGMLNTLPAEIPHNLDIKMEYYNVCDDRSIVTYVLIGCPNERLFKITLRKLKPRLRDMAAEMEATLAKNLQKSVRLRLVIHPPPQKAIT